MNSKKLVSSLAILAMGIALVPQSHAASDELTGAAATGKPAASLSSEVKTDMAANVDQSATSATSFFLDSTGFADGDQLLVGNEVITMTDLTGNNATTMARARTVNGTVTTAEAHAIGDTVRHMKQVVQLVFESGDYVIQSGDKIVVTVPDNFDNFENLTAADVSTTLESTLTVNGTETFAQTSGSTATGGTITITATGDAPNANEAITIAIGGTNKLTMPATPGHYAFQIAVKNQDDEVIETGYAMLAWANEVRVRAVVDEALILTIDNALVNLNVDPSVNFGIDASQKTTLSVATNANSGYKIQAKLLDAAGNAALKNGSVATISSGNARTTENRFGYVAYNSSVTKTQAQLESDAAAAQTFGSSAADMALYDGTASGVGTGSVTNEWQHTIYYFLNVDYLTPAGTYTGTLTYTAVPTF